MSAYYHTPLLTGTPLSALAIEQPFQELDFALYRLAQAEQEFVNLSAKPSSPAAGYRKVYIRNGHFTLQDPSGSESTLYTYVNYMQFADVKVNTDGGSFVNGAWRTRDLTTIVYGDGLFATLLSNQITLDAGIYRISASAPANNVNKHVTRWYNITDASEEIGGSTASALGKQTRSWIAGQFTLATSKVFELQHQCMTTNANSYARGEGSNWGNAVFSIVELWKL